MSRRIDFGFMTIGWLCLAMASLTAVAAPPAGPAGASAGDKPAPPTLLIDNFEAGIDRWTNADSGAMVQAKEPSGNHFLQWTASDDGIGRIILKQLTREKIDLSRYDILQFRYRVMGKPLWNLNPILQQHPFLHGYRGLYYSVDSLDITLDKWQTCTLDLRMVENAWPDTFSTEKQEFQFELQQGAGVGQTVVCLDDIMLLRNTLGVERSYAGQWRRETSGDQVFDFSMPIRNSGAASETVKLTVTSPEPTRFAVEVLSPTLIVGPGATMVFKARVTIPAAVAAKAKPYDGQTLRAEFTTESQPNLRLAALLPCGIKPAKIVRPQLLCTPERARELRTALANPALAKDLPASITKTVQAAQPGGPIASFEPSYPPCAISATYYKTCPFDGVALVETPMPNLPEATFQCPSCGRFQRGMFYESAIRDWAGTHRNNAELAAQAGTAYLLTGDKACAEKAARILKGYIDNYLRLPQGALSLYSEIASSGSARITGSYMHERVWLSNLAIALDCIWDSGALSDADKEAIRTRVFVPSATNMMDHRVGPMNLQWMINAGVVNAGLACEDAALVSRGLYSDHGVVPLIDAGYTAEGLWHENPSYQNVQALAAYPLLATLYQTGILTYTPEMDQRYKAMWNLAAPDNRFPALGTGGTPNLGNFIDGAKSIAHLSIDPEIAWIDASNSRDGNPFRNVGTRVPAEKHKAINPGTIVFPDYGVAVLRSRQVLDKSPISGGAKVEMYSALDFGRHLVHGHYNKLSVNAWGKGGWFLRNIEGGYGPGFEQFTEATASNSTVMVDGRRQDQDTGELTFQRTLVGLGGMAGAVDVASAREAGAWKETEHERTLVQSADWLLMIDRCVSDTSRVYEWLAHLDTTGLAWSEGPAVKQEIKVTGEVEAQGGTGGPRAATRPRDKVTTLGQAPCYQYFLPAHEMALAPKSQVLRLARTDGSGLRLSLIDTDNSSFFRARGGQSLIWRKSWQETSFVAVFQPYRKGETPSLTATSVPLTNARSGKPILIRDAQAIRLVPEGGQPLLIVVNYTGTQLKTTDGVAIPGTDRVLVLPTK